MRIADDIFHAVAVMLQVNPCHLRTVAYCRIHILDEGNILFVYLGKIGGAFRTGY